MSTGGDIRASVSPRQCLSWAGDQERPGLEEVTQWRQQCCEKKTVSALEVRGAQQIVRAGVHVALSAVPLYSVPSTASVEVLLVDPQFSH